MSYETYDIGDGVEMRIAASHKGAVVSNLLYTLTIIEPARPAADADGILPSRAALPERTTVLTHTTKTVTVSGVPTVTTGLTNFVVDAETGEYVYTFAVMRARKHEYHYQITGGSLAAAKAYFNGDLSRFIAES